MTLFKSTLIILALTYCIAACKNKETPKVEHTVDNFNQIELQENIGNNLILPSLEVFKNQANALKTKNSAFIDSPTATTLLDAQNAWKQCATAWKQCELYNFGPMEDKLINYSVDSWPSDTATISTFISTENNITSAFIAGKSNYTKGLGALEFLLFASGGSEATINNFTDEQYAENRKKYLTALSEHFSSMANALYNSWASGGENYIDVFNNSLGRKPESSLSDLLNNMVLLTEAIQNMKLGTPMGKMNAGVAIPNKLEARRSISSISHIKNNLKAIENCFLGQSLAGEDKQGFDDLLNYIDAKADNQALSQRIKDAISDANSKINALEPSLEQAIANEPQKVEDAYAAIKKLLLLLKVDMSSALGIQILFSDNDGD